MEIRKYMRCKPLQKTLVILTRRDLKSGPLIDNMTDTVGELIDIGPGGLSFRYKAKRQSTLSKNRLILVMAAEHRSIEVFPVRVVYDSASRVEGPESFERIAGVDFKYVNEIDRGNIEDYISACTDACSLQAARSNASM